MKRLLLIIFFIFCLPLQGMEGLHLDIFNEPVEMSKITKEAELRLKLVSTLLQESERAAIELEGLEVTSDKFEEIWHKRFKSFSRKLMQDQMDIAKATPAQRKRFWWLFEKIEFRKIIKVLTNQIDKATILARFKGTGVIFTLLISQGVRLSLAAILFATGQQMLGTVMLNVFGVPEALFAHSVVANLFVRKKMQKLLGGKEKYKNLRKVEATIRKELKLTSVDDYILPIRMSENEVLGVVVEKQNLWLNFIRYIGASKERLTYRRLSQFIEKHNINDAEIRGLLAAKNMSKDLKAVLIVQRLFNDGIANTDQLADFRLTFSGSLTAIKGVANWEELQNWVRATLRANSTQDILFQFERIPETAKPEQIYYLWKQVIFPHFATHEDQVFSYRELRQLVTNSHALEAQLFTNKKPLVDAEATSWFKAYFLKAFEKKGKINFCSHDQVIRGLLN